MFKNKITLYTVLHSFRNSVFLILKSINFSHQDQNHIVFLERVVVPTLKITALQQHDALLCFGFIIYACKERFNMKVLDCLSAVLGGFAWCHEYFGCICLKVFNVQFKLKVNNFHWNYFLQKK